MPGVATARPADAVRFAEIVLLLTPRMFLARTQEPVDEKLVRRKLNVVRGTIVTAIRILGAEIVRLKDTRIAIAPEQDQRVRQRLELRLHHTLKRLQRL